MRRAAMRRDHPERLAAAAQHRRRLHDSVVGGLRDLAQRRIALVALDVLDDDAPAPLQRAPGRAVVVRRDGAKDFEEALVEAVLHDDAQQAVVAEELYGALVAAEQREGGRED